MIQQTALASSTGISPEPVLNGLRVLIIDDSATVRRSAENLLKQLGCEVFQAADGFEGLSKVIACDPALILLDVMMPRLDGYATCNMLKRNPRFRHTPVIMLSGNDGLFDQARGRLNGADDYLVKPFTHESLLHSLSAFSSLLNQPTDGDN